MGEERNEVIRMSQSLVKAIKILDCFSTKAELSLIDGEVVCCVGLVGGSASSPPAAAPSPLAPSAPVRCRDSCVVPALRPRPVFGGMVTGGLCV